MTSNCEKEAEITILSDRAPSQLYCSSFQSLRVYQIPREQFTEELLTSKT